MDKVNVSKLYNSTDDHCIEIYIQLYSLITSTHPLFMQQNYVIVF